MKSKGLGVFLIMVFIFSYANELGQVITYPNSLAYEKIGISVKLAKIVRFRRFNFF